MRRSCSILSLWALTEPCESDSQTSGTLWFYDIICFLTHVSCSVLNCCMFEGASHFHRHFFANQSLSPSRASSRGVVVTRCFTRCGAVHFFRQRQLFAWPRSSLCLREAELGETDFAQFHSESDKSRLSRRRRSKEGYLAICLILFFSVFLWMSWGGLDRDISGGGWSHCMCSAWPTSPPRTPSLSLLENLKIKDSVQNWRWTFTNDKTQRTLGKTPWTYSKRLKKGNVLKNEKNKGERNIGDQIEVVGDNIET